jgi:hypothetical protein
MRRFWASRLVFFLVALAALLAPGIAKAEAAWGPTTEISAVDEDVWLPPSVALDPRGNAYVAWTRFGPTSVGLIASRDAATGTWNKGAPFTSGGSPPRLAVDNQGNVFAVWQSFIAPHVKVSIRRASTGQWGRHRDLSGLNVGGTGMNPDIAVDPRGDAVVIWVRRSSHSTFLVESAYRPAGGPWQSPVVLGGNSQGTSIKGQVAFDGAGNATALWMGVDSGELMLQTSVRSAQSGLWSPAEDRAPGADCSGEPDLAVNAAGEAVAAWICHVVHVATRTAEGSWTAPQALSVPETNTFDSNQHVAIDANGRAIAVWEQSQYNGYDPVPERRPVQASVRVDSGAPWGAPAPLDGSLGSYPQVAFGPKGKAIAVWTGAGIRANVWSAEDDAWQGATTVSTPGYAPGLGFDSKGNALAVWGEAGANYMRVAATPYDDAGPVMRRLTISRNRFARAPVDFRARLYDVWSRPVTTTWDFGDGANATGLHVTHSYAAPGSYLVTLSAADALGNATAVSRNVTIETAYCSGSPATAVGTDGSDHLVGSEGDDVLVGLGGADEVDGLGGNDKLCLGAGADVGNGREGDDSIFGGAGPDYLRGGPGDDFLNGGAGIDTCRQNDGSGQSVKCER